MLDVASFVPSDVNEIELNYSLPAEQRLAFARHGNIVGATARKNGKIIVMGGVTIMWPGVGEGWIMLSKHAHKTPVTVAKYAGDVFDVIMKNANLTRVQASVIVTDPKAVRFAKWMGFDNEGIMKKYGPDGSDYYRMARVL